MEFWTLLETTHAGEFIRNADAESFDAVTALSGQVLTAGSVVGKIERTLAAAPDPAVVGAGNGTMTNVKPGPRAKVGDYVVTCTVAAANGGTFSVVDPDGDALPDFVMAAGAGASTDYASDQMNFTVTDGANDFAVGDVFTITVTDGATPVAVGTGDGVLSALSLGRLAKDGTYRLECIAETPDGGTFSVVNPGGKSMAKLVMTAGAGASTDYKSDQINFTITDGATDFALGDYFHIVVARPATYGQVTEYDPTVYDGRHHAAGVMLEAVDASAAPAEGAAVVRDAEVLGFFLAWNANRTAAEQAAAIEDLNANMIAIRT